MLLNKTNLQNINGDLVTKPKDKALACTERVLQFGTGVLLRGLPDCFIDKANNEGVFNGRIVMVKSTSQGDVTDFEKQDNLYTLCIRGLAGGDVVEQDIINASISRVLDAKEQWNTVLDCARDKNISVIISNTTETGIRLVQEKLKEQAPQSFPAKLLAVMYERFKVHGISEDSGFTIVPTELITENASVLKSILIELATYNNLPEAFLLWLTHSNKFCNSLVDRIVPGKLSNGQYNTFSQQSGYDDNLAIMAEPYCLWAIEGDDSIKARLSFCKANDGVVITGDITKFKELKLRLLNGTHTFCCALAFLKGFTTVKEAMQDSDMTTFIRQLMLEEIAPSIPYDIPDAEKEQYAEQVIDRFSNPFIEHKWLSISLNYSAKMRLRNIALLKRYFELNSSVPERMATGFAAFLKFVKPAKQEGKEFWGEYNGKAYRIDDDQAGYYFQVWSEMTGDEAIKTILRNTDLWDADLSILPGFAEAVINEYKKW